MEIKEIKGALIGQVLGIEINGEISYFPLGFMGLKTDGKLKLYNDIGRKIITISREEAEDLAMFGNTYTQSCQLHVASPAINWEMRQWDIYKTLMSNYTIKDQSVLSPRADLMYQIAERAVQYYKEQRNPAPKTDAFEVIQNMEREESKGST